MVRGPLYHRFWTLAKGLLGLVVPRDVRAAEARDDGLVDVHGSPIVFIEGRINSIRLKNALKFAHKGACLGLYRSAKRFEATAKDVSLVNIRIQNL